MEQNLPKDLTFEQLRIHYHVQKGDSRKVGRYRETWAIDAVKTDIGDIETAEWCELARQLIAEHHEEALQAQMLEWVTENDYTRATAAQREQEALSLHISRIFDDPQWVGYIPFNRRYRPEVYEAAHLVWIIPSCCQKKGLTTQEQIDTHRAAKGMGVISCPHCGRFSEFKIVEE